MSMENVPSSEADKAGSEPAPSRRSAARRHSSIFMLQNTEDVTIEFLFWDFEWPLWLLTLLSALVGALVWFGLGVLRRHRRREERRDDRRD